MMAIHNEKPFEDEIVSALQPDGWLYSPNDAGYDRKRALFPADVLGWLGDTQPDTLQKALAHGGEDKLLNRLAAALDAPFEASGGQQGGTLAVLRRGFTDVPNTFRMAQFKPADELNATTNEHYAKMRVRVMRQVHYSLQNQNSIDLVLFVNGIPVATLELKTDFTQSVHDAITQYKQNRAPKREPLLGFGRRALVHFAVSNREVWMTTKLTGPDTTFLPFNRGDHGRAGNPLNPNGSSTSYLWESVLQRDNWLDILGRFLHLQISKNVDPVTGKVGKRETLLFPRYHQWESVTHLIRAARAEGAGHRYLIQHSAGSGKTNSIAWIAHQLSTLHNPAGEKVFDSVIVVTDRTVLDSQLRSAIQQIDAKSGVVTGIESGLEAKSKQLADAVRSRTPIIIVTIQSFGFVADQLSGHSNGRFAIIADEAHSSQTGATAGKLKEVLTADEAADLDDGGEVDTETILAAHMSNRADSTNISYFAYTATPKSKTLELFGRRNEDGLPRPFHVYTMQQAIDEGYILDVLKNYTPYKVAFKLAHNGQEYDSDAPLVDQKKALTELMQFVHLHEYNISQKVELIIEHFLANVAWRLGGKAKAMVVTGSRKQAVRYKLAFDDYVKRTGRQMQVQALVAFSGRVLDPDSGPEPFSEISMNPGLKGRSLPTAFASDSYQIMLVSNKFQTGFDQPLLVGMYVDKKLSGVTTVQTLSRLNRTATGKDFTCVLDFVNDPEEILAAFQPYYRDARLTEVSDPNVIVDLRNKLEAVGIWEEHEVNAAANAMLLGKGNNAFFAAIGPGRDRFAKRYQAAVKAEDGEERDRLDVFRSDITAFVNGYDFLSQIINFGDIAIEKLAIYARGLARLIRDEVLRTPIDLTGVELVGYSIRPKDGAELELTGEGELPPAKVGNTKLPADPKLAALWEAIEQLNTLFDADWGSDVDAKAFVEHVSGKVGEDEQIVAQRAANSEQQFLASPNLKQAVITGLVQSQENAGGMTNELFGDEQKLARFVEIIGRLLYRGRDAA